MLLIIRMKRNNMENTIMKASGTKCLPVKYCF